MSQLNAGTVRMFVCVHVCVCEEKERQSLCINRV